MCKFYQIASDEIPVMYGAIAFIYWKAQKYLYTIPFMCIVVSSIPLKSND